MCVFYICAPDLIEYRKRSVVYIKRRTYLTVTMFRILLQTILITNCFCALKEIEVSKKFSSSSSSLCISKLSDKYFTSWHVNLFFVNSSRDQEVLKDLFKTVHDKIIRDLTKFKWNYVETNKEYAIIVSKNVEELLLYKSKIEELWLWNARCKFIFIFQEHFGNLSLIFEVLWDYYMVNSLVAIPSKNSADTMEIYSWFPFLNNSCGQSQKYELFNICEFGKFSRNANMFVQKVPANFNGCPVVGKAVVWSPFVMEPDDSILADNKALKITQGIETMMLKTFSEVLNFTFLIYSSTVPQNWGISTQDGKNKTGIIKEIFQRKVDIGFGNFGPTEGRRRFCDYSASHIYESVTWCVPIAQIVPKWRTLLSAFKISTWLSMLIVYLLVSIITYKISKFAPIDMTYSSIKNCFQNLFSIFLGLAVNRTPNKVSARILLFVWIFFGFHFVAAYQAKLISALLYPLYEKQISTIEEIFDSKLNWAIMPTLNRVFENNDDWRVAKLLREWKSCFDADKCLQRIAEKQDFAVFMSETHSRFERWKYTNENGEPLIFCFPSYMKFTAELYMTKGFLLKDKIDQLIYRIRPSGLINKWKIDLTYSLMLRNRKNRSGVKHNQTLSLLHLQGVFLIWNFGIGLSLISFVLEILVHKLRSVFNTRNISFSVND